MFILYLLPQFQKLRDRFTYNVIFHYKLIGDDINLLDAMHIICPFGNSESAIALVKNECNVNLVGNTKSMD